MVHVSPSLSDQREEHPLSSEKPAIKCQSRDSSMETFEKSNELRDICGRGICIIEDAMGIRGTGALNTRLRIELLKYLSNALFSNIYEHVNST